MKKLSVILCVVLLAALMLPLTAGAEFPGYEGDQTFNLNNKAPTIDGKIDPSEGWSNKGYFDETHTGRFLAQLPLTSKGEFYFAYDNDGLYFAYTMKEYGAAYTLRLYETVYSEEEGREVDQNTGGINYPDSNAENYDETNYPETTPDGNKIDGALLPPDFNTVEKRDPTQEHIRSAFWIANGGNTNEYCTSEDGGDYAFDGDVFALSIDALGMFRPGCSNNENQDKAPQFNVGIFEGDVVKVRTSRYSERDVTVEGKAAGSIKGDTITFEVMIPWDVIVEDSNAAAQALGLNHTFTKEEMIAPGATHRASVSHMDRYNDPDAGYVDDWGRCITVCNYCDYAIEQFPDGVPGVASSGDGIKSLGLKLVIPGGAAPTDDTTKAAEGGEETEAVTDKDGKVVTDEKGNVVTQKKTGGSTTKAAGTNGKGGGSGSSAQTFDAGIAVALGALATSAIGVYYSKKRR